MLQESLGISSFNHPKGSAHSSGRDRAGVAVVKDSGGVG